MSFIPSYLLATSNNESPPTYHRWACLSCLSVLAGRRFWFRLGPFTFYPNFYTVLVGDPGVKKSAAMDVAKNVVREVSKAIRGQIPVAATSTTKEAITNEMASDKFPGKRMFTNPAGLLETYTQLAIFATEFTNFLGVQPQNMLDFLTGITTEAVYDERFKNKGNAYFVGPYITMLACMTPETVKGYLKLNILTGGFARRTMFVFGTRGKPNPWPGFSSEQQTALAHCVELGKALQNRSGEFFLSEEAQQWYETWYIENGNSLIERKPIVRSYYSTKFEFLFKAAMLVGLSQIPEGEPLLITAEMLQFLNDRFFSPVEEVLERVFEGAGINPNSGAVIQVCRMLESMDIPMGLKQLEVMFIHDIPNMSEFRDAIANLCAVGRLAQRNISGNGQFYGTIIGTPLAVQKCSDVEAVALLSHRVQTISKDTDSSL